MTLTESLHAELEGVPAQPSTMDTEPNGHDLHVFEGPEKKLEVFFSHTASADGFRAFSQPVWSELLADASCSILHLQSNASFDAYLLSESSLFVYPYRVILKTCGQTTLLLVLPKLLALAKQLGAQVDHVNYGHYRYKFPSQQHYPHLSLEQEERYLAETLLGHIGPVNARNLGPPDGRCWFTLCTERPAWRDETTTNTNTKVAPASPVAHRLLTDPSSPPSPVSGAAEGADDIFEVAMEGLSPAVCSIFFESSHPGCTGRALAVRMTQAAGFDDLMPGVQIDDWAFEPCGYSMNGLRGEFYYTIHITPELGFSYASFETNDPSYRHPSIVAKILSLFQPAVATVTLTTRRVVCDLPLYQVDDYSRTAYEQVALSRHVSVCAINFSRDGVTASELKALGLSDDRHLFSELGASDSISTASYLSSALSSSSPTLTSPHTSPPMSEADDERLADEHLKLDDASKRPKDPMANGLLATA